MNDLFLFIEKCKLYNYAVDNSLDSSSDDLLEALCNLKRDGRNAIDWFMKNGMQANPDKFHWCAILIAHQIVMAKHGGSCVHFSRLSTCGRTSRETVSHSQRQPLPTPHKKALPVYVTVTNKRLQPLTTTLYNSLVLPFSLLTTKRRLIKHRSFLRVLRSS